MKRYEVSVVLRTQIETRMPTEEDVAGAVRDLIDTLGLGGKLTVVATEVIFGE